LAGRSAVRWVDWDVRTVFCGEQLHFAWSVSRPISGLGYSDSVVSCAAAHWLFGQRSDGGIVTMRLCFVVSSCLLASWSAVRCSDCDVQTGVCGEQLPIGWSVSGPMGGLGS
jgi:hypothetical protein